MTRRQYSAKNGERVNVSMSVRAKIHPKHSKAFQAIMKHAEKALVAQLNAFMDAPDVQA